ncbi:MAG: hypothetical protein U0U67_15075 [Chitinophagales bacterium]
MCTVSNKIKFCSCSVNDVTELNNYWILHRKVNGKKTIMIGEFFDNSYIHFTEFKTNNKILCNRLNEADAFDKLILFNESDNLEVVLNNTDFDGQKRSVYCFVFKKSIWKSTGFDPFELTNKFNEINFGIFENPFIEKII